MAVRGDTGSASVLAAAIVCVLLAAGLVVVRFAAILAVRTQVSAAADLAAAAGATRLGVIDGGECRAAAVVADANGVALDRCIVADDSVRVEVSRSLSLGGRTRDVRARAHARLEARL